MLPNLSCLLARSLACCLLASALQEYHFYVLAPQLQQAALMAPVSVSTDQRLRSKLCDRCDSKTPMQCAGLPFPSRGCGCMRATFGWLCHGPHPSQNTYRCAFISTRVHKGVIAAPGQRSRQPGSKLCDRRVLFMHASASASACGDLIGSPEKSGNLLACGVAS